MNPYQKVLAVLTVMLVGIWGCAQKPVGNASAEKARGLEAKVARLEEDFRAATAARDQFRKKLGEAEAITAQYRQEVESLQPVVKERDDLQALLKARTTERDHMAIQFDGFRKSLKDLLGATEATIIKPALPTATTVSKPKGPNL